MFLNGLSAGQSEQLGICPSRCEFGCPLARFPNPNFSPHGEIAMPNEKQYPLTPQQDNVPASVPPPQETPGLTISVTVELKLDLHLLRKQKHALIGLYEGATVTFEQEDAAGGMLNLLDFLQDSILEQGGSGGRHLS
jgi:hypothetical protein